MWLCCSLPLLLCHRGHFHSTGSLLLKKLKLNKLLWTTLPKTIGPIGKGLLLFKLGQLSRMALEKGMERMKYNVMNKYNNNYDHHILYRQHPHNHHQYDCHSHRQQPKPQPQPQPQPQQQQQVFTHHHHHQYLYSPANLLDYYGVGGTITDMSSHETFGDYVSFDDDPYSYYW